MKFEIIDEELELEETLKYIEVEELMGVSDRVKQCAELLARVRRAGFVGKERAFVKSYHTFTDEEFDQAEELLTPPKPEFKKQIKVPKF